MKKQILHACINSYNNILFIHICLHWYCYLDRHHSSFKSMTLASHYTLSQTWTIWPQSTSWRRAVQHRVTCTQWGWWFTPYTTKEGLCLWTGTTCCPTRVMLSRLVRQLFSISDFIWSKQIQNSTISLTPNTHTDMSHMFRMCEVF